MSKKVQLVGVHTRCMIIWRKVSILKVSKVNAVFQTTGMLDSRVRDTRCYRPTSELSGPV